MVPGGGACRGTGLTEARSSGGACSPAVRVGLAPLGVGDLRCSRGCSRYAWGSTTPFPLLTEGLSCFLLFLRHVRKFGRCWSCILANHLSSLARSGTPTRISSSRSVGGSSSRWELCGTAPNRGSYFRPLVSSIFPKGDSAAHLTSTTVMDAMLLAWVSAQCRAVS